jgi:glycosyltransferase involved in cell wall biosynthesis
VIEYFGVSSERVKAIPHGIPTDSYSTGAAHTDAVTAIVDAISHGTRLILATGTIEPRKDYPTLLRAFDLLAADDPDVILVIAGHRGWGAEEFDGTLGNLNHRDRVRVLGWVDNTDRAWLYGHASVFTYPSRYEGFGLPPLEAMRVGVPTVVTNVAAVREVVGDAALAVPIGDAEGFADAVSAILRDKGVRERLRSEGFKRVARYRWDHTGELMRAWYRQVVG